MIVYRTGKIDRQETLGILDRKVNAMTIPNFSVDRFNPPGRTLPHIIYLIQTKYCFTQANGYASSVKYSLVNVHPGILSATVPIEYANVTVPIEYTSVTVPIEYASARTMCRAEESVKKTTDSDS